jgi:aminopeptidase N
VAERGHASWYQFVYAEEKGFFAEDTEGYPDETGYATLEELMRAVYAHFDQWRAESGPVALPSSSDTLFDFNRYHGGALVLYALREKIGTRAFDGFLRAWLYDEETPPMPNHPDWTVDPVEASVAALRQARAARPTP